MFLYSLRANSTSLPLGLEGVQTPIRIGTRGSPLALAQTRAVIAALSLAHGWTPDQAEAYTRIVPIKTSGDRIQDRPLADLGGKGLFAKELEEALLANEIDCAVHSLKDMPTILPPGLVLDCVLEREDPRDVLISESGKKLADLPLGTTIGTSSVRRQALLLNRRPDLKMAMLRGNVDTRMSKVASGAVDATILALAGLKRLNKATAASAIFSIEEMLPAVAQGAIGIEQRQADDKLRECLHPINHRNSRLAVMLERAYLSVLDGSCKTPIAGLATLNSANELIFTGCAVSPDGKIRFDVKRNSRVTSESEATELGTDAGEELLGVAGRKFFQV